MESKLTGLRFPQETLNKLKYISWHDRETFTALVLDMAEKRIKTFEKANGEITPVLLVNAKIK